MMKQKLRHCLRPGVQKNPLEIKAIKVIKNTDVAVDKDASALIFVNNEKNSVFKPG